MATLIFVLLRPCGGQLRRAVLPELWRDRIQHLVRYADIGKYGLATILTPGHQHMAGLLAEEGDGERRAESIRPDLARCAVEPRRHVDRDDRHGHCPDQLHEIVAQALGEAGAEQRIDDETGAIERAHGLDRSGPAFRHDGGISLKPRALAKESKPDRPAP